MRGSTKIELRAQSSPERRVADIVFFFEGDAIHPRDLSERAKAYTFTGKNGQMFTLEHVDGYAARIVCGLGKRTAFTRNIWKEALAEAFVKLQELKYDTVSIAAELEMGEDYFEIGKTIALAAGLTNYRFDTYKSAEDKKKHMPVTNITYTDGRAGKKEMTRFAEGVAYGQLLAAGVSLTRDLVNEPASALGSDEMVAAAQEIAARSKGTINVEVLDKDQCAKLGMGSFLSVAQGSDREPRFIILRRQSSNPDAQNVCFIGKSILFDTGGYSLKPPDFMMDMKIDMAGGASVLGLFSILASWDEQKFGELGVTVYGVLPVCENMISGRATRPGDIATAMNGKTIEILNTDAEGRLALADALVYAERNLKSDYIIDFATLTGACVVALGKKIAGYFCDNDQLASAFETVAAQEGDEAWQLPLHKPYAELMVSDIAQLKNIGGGRYGGAITAALFMKEFVDKAAWMHVDIAGPAYNDESPKGTIPKGGTGWGVVTLVEMLRHWDTLMR